MSVYVCVCASRYPTEMEGVFTDIKRNCGVCGKSWTTRPLIVNICLECVSKSGPQCVDCGKKLADGKACEDCIMRCYRSACHKPWDIRKSGRRDCDDCRKQDVLRMAARTQRFMERNQEQKDAKHPS